MAPPLALDIDGTLTTGRGRIDARVFELLPDWDAPVVFATGKAFPYPVALAHFLGREETVIAENGGVAYVDGDTSILGDPAVPRAVVEAFEARGGEIGWGDGDTVNRWRETEVALSLDADERLALAGLAEREDAVVDHLQERVDSDRRQQCDRREDEQPGDRPLVGQSATHRFSPARRGVCCAHWALAVSCS